MKRFVALFAVGIVAAGLGLTAFAHEGEDHGKKAEGKKVTIQGELIDTACFITSDGDAKGKDHAECATKCMGTGVPAGILPAGAKDARGLLFLLTNPVPLAPYASKTIKVEGTQYGDMHAIDAQKVWVQDGSNWKEIQLKDEHHKMGGGAADDHKGHDHK